MADVFSWQLAHRDLWYVAGTTLAVWFAWWLVGLIVFRRQGGRPWLAWHAFGLCFGLWAGMGWFLSGTNEPAAPWIREAAAALVLAGAWLLAVVVDRIFWRNFLRRHHLAAPTLLRQAGAFVILLAAAAIVLTYIYGIKIPGLIATSGVAALVVGLAMQDLLGNLIAGFSIHLTRAYKAGDWLLIDGKPCEVMEIHWRATRFRTRDNIWLEIANNQLVKERITSLTFPDRFHAMRLEVGADYDVPPDKVKDSLLRAARAVPGVRETPAVKVFVKDFGPSAIVYQVKFWMDDQSSFDEITDGIRTRVWYEFHREGIRIPYPVQTLEVRRPAKAAPRTDSGRVRDCLRQQDLFSCLTDDEVASLAGRCPVLLFGREETVLREGTPGDSMFLVVEGHAEVSIRRDGQTRRVATLGPGECFGEMSLLTGETRTATVVAADELLVAEVGKELLAPILAERPGLVEAFSDLLSKRREALAAAGMAAGDEEAPEGGSPRPATSTLIGRIRRFFEGR